MRQSISNYCAMTYDLFLGLALFAFVSSITPGPNNLMLMASGANFGFQRTIPHMVGVGLGFVLMIVLVGNGLGQVFERVPQTYSAMKAASVGYLLYLAWKIAHAAPANSNSAAGRPMTFLQAAAFQWVNPKAWFMALTAISVYSADQSGRTILIVATVFGLINLPSVGVWVLLGQQVTRVLTNPARLQVFNWTMAGLLVLSLYPVLAPG